MILAAGEASRMGAPKPALPYGDSTLVGSVIARACSAGLSPIVVVTGFHQEAVEHAVGDAALIVHNPNAEDGNMSSLLTGLCAIDDSDAVIVLLSDMPDVDAAVIQDLAAGVVGSGAQAGWVDYTDGRGHPIALARAAFVQVSELTGPKALWPYLSSVAAEDRFVVTVSSKRPADVNTPEEYARSTGSDDSGANRDDIHLRP